MNNSTHFHLAWWNGDKDAKAHWAWWKEVDDSLITDQSLSDNLADMFPN